MPLLVLPIKNPRGGEEIVADLSTQKRSLDTAQGNGQSFPFNRVNHGVVPRKTILEVFKIARFCRGSSKKCLLVVAGDIDSSNGELSRT